MPSVIDNLRMFNRKERFYLVGMALGNTAFRLSQQFRSKIGEALHLKIPEDAFAAMDYHLDWIYASLYLSTEGTTSGLNPITDSRLISANQEDIDFLVAYENEDGCHIILLEAKGATGFTNQQFRSKVQRLGAIFSESWRGVIPHFAVVSPREPKRVDSSWWPEWLKPGGAIRCVELDLPKELELKKITRCDVNGKPSFRGTYWKLDPERRLH